MSRSTLAERCLSYVRDRWGAAPAEIGPIPDGRHSRGGTLAWAGRNGGSCQEMIVCGVDDSNGARDAASVAARLGADLGVWLALVHVPPPPVAAAIAPAAYVYPGEGDHEAAIDAGETLLDCIAGGLGTSQGVTRHVVVGDDASERLRAIAEDEGAQLIVVGSRGRGPLPRPCSGASRARLPGTRRARS